MTSSELFATARHVAKDFCRLTSQITKDFAFDEENNNYNSQRGPSCVKTQQFKKHFSEEGSVHDNNRCNNRSVAFTVGFKGKQALSPVPNTLQLPNKTKKSRPTAQDLEEKQRKAEERRNVSVILFQCGHSTRNVTLGR